MIITFYSFKGGVGRSMALANVAELLAERGLRVLVIDFDLEAPGLERFFDSPDTITSAVAVPEHRGVIDLLVSYRELQALPPAAGVPGQREALSTTSSREPVRDFVIPIRDSVSGGGSVLMLPAGRRAGAEYAAYADRVRSFDWNEFYLRWEGEEFLDWFREETQRLADVVLLDSRTGITELSGVCTFHLADAVLMFIAPNLQNLEGCRLIAESLSAPDLISEGRHGRALPILAVPSRVERSESDLLSWFASEFDQQVGHFVSPGLRFENSPFIDLQIPYVPRYAFLETVAVREPEHPAASDIIAAYKRLVSAVVQLAPRWSRMYRAVHELGAPGVDREMELVPHFVGRQWILDRVNAWLDLVSGETMLLLTGEPGSGKTTMLRWLAGGAPEAASEQGSSSGLHAKVVYAHECVAADERTLDAKYFVQALAGRLATILPEYGVDYNAAQHPGIVVDVKQNISATGLAGGVVVERVVVGDVAAQVAFDSLIRQPLLGVDLSDLRLLVLVDAIEESLLSPSENSILDLLTYLNSLQLPACLRLLVTSRDDPRVLGALDADRLRLNADAPHTAAEIREYAWRRLATVPQRDQDHPQDDLVDMIVQVSDGNFLYARSLLDAVVSEGGSILQTDPQLVPASLNDFYKAEMKRQLGGHIERWDRDALLFGTLAVEPTGFTSAQLAGITGRGISEVGKAVRRWGQFLESSSDGRLRLYHRSFVQWLLENGTFQVEPEQAHAAIAHYFISDYRGAWITCEDSAALENTARHLLAALESGAAGRASREGLLRELTELFADRTFLEARIAKSSADSLRRDIAAAVAVLVERSTYSDAAESVYRQIYEAAQVPIAEDRVPTADTLLSRTGSAIARVYAESYRALRDTREPGTQRTAAMTNLVAQVQRIAQLARWVPFDVDALMSGDPGERIVGLAVWQARPEAGRFDLLLDAIAASRSAFEQYQALVVAGQVIPLLDDNQRQALAEMLHTTWRDERGIALSRDSSRVQLITSLLTQLAPRAQAALERAAEPIGHGSAKASVLANIAVALAATNPDRVARLIADGERAAESITNRSGKASVLANIAVALAATNPDQAARLITDAEGYFPAAAWATMR